MSAMLITMVTVLGVSAPLAPARAQMWPDRAYEQLQPEPAPPGYSRVRPVPQHPLVGRKLVHRNPKDPAKQASAPPEGAKPHGPLVIAISITRQHLRIYDQDGLFAESPVSTGMRGHPTPMGVFSVIQKSKYHRSNIYSGAPMPYMQRITWSGVALHAGVLPGYPASHGCIRMPMAFAVKLWGWSRLGARVIIAPEDVEPTAIAHQALMARPMAPQPAPPSLAAASDAAAAAKVTTGKAGVVDGATSPAGPHVGLEHEPLRPAVTDRVRIADAETNLPPAGPARDGGAQAKVVTDAPPQASDAAPAPPRSTDATSPSGATAPATAENDKAALKEPGTSAASGVATAQHENAAGDRSPDQGAGAAAARKDPPPASAAQASTPAPAVAPPADLATTPRRSGHVAVLISRKTGRLYVRQNFEPWFDVPVTIAHADHPLGTNVFTATANPAEAGALRWTVMSLPQLPKHHDAADDTPRRGKRPAPAAEAEAAPLPTPAEVLDRVTIPADVVARIAAALVPGSSIIVSDQGLGDETGLGTDFIVPLR